jgi:hypothetical protein
MLSMAVCLSKQIDLDEVVWENLSKYNIPLRKSQAILVLLQQKNAVVFVYFVHISSMRSFFLCIARPKVPRGTEADFVASRRIRSPQQKDYVARKRNHSCCAHPFLTVIGVAAKSVI